MYIWSYVILDLDISDLAWFHLGIIKYYFAGLLNYSTLHLGLHLLAFEKKKIQRWNWKQFQYICTTREFDKYLCVTRVSFLGDAQIISVCYSWMVL